MDTNEYKAVAVQAPHFQADPPQPSPHKRTDHRTKAKQQTLWEPCTASGARVYLPTSLSLLDDLSPVLNMDTFKHLLSDKERESLQALLPKEEPLEQQQTLEELFGGENFFFGNPMKQFQANFKAGFYHSSVVRYKEKVTALQKRKRIHDEHEYKSNLLQQVLAFKQSAGLIGLGSYEESLIEPTSHAPPPATANTTQPKRRKTAGSGKRAKMADEGEDQDEMEVEIEVVEEEVPEGEEDSRTAMEVDKGPSSSQPRETGGFNGSLLAMEELDNEDGEKEAEEEAPEGGEEEDGDEVDVGASDTESSGAEGSTSRRRKSGDKKRVVGADGADDDKPSKRKRGSSRKKEVMRPKKVPIIFVLFSKIKAAFSAFNFATTAENIVNKLDEAGDVQELVLPSYTLPEFVDLALKYLSSPPPLAPPAMVGPGPSTSKASEPMVKFDKNKQVWRWIDHHSSRAQLQAIEQLFYFSASRALLDRKTGQDKSNLAKQQKRTLTIGPSTSEMVTRFREQEAERYTRPSKPFTYTTSGLRTIVAPLRRSNPSNKPREHFLLKTGRPPHINLLSLVRDAASRLPGGVGTRPDVALLLRDSQWVVEDVTDTQLNTVVSGALDRLHSQKDPCVRFDPDQKLWIYLHRQRREHEFAPVEHKRAKKAPQDFEEEEEPDMDQSPDSSLPPLSAASMLFSSPMQIATPSLVPTTLPPLSSLSQLPFLHSPPSPQPPFSMTANDLAGSAFSTPA